MWWCHFLNIKNRSSLSSGERLASPNLGIKVVIQREMKRAHANKTYFHFARVVRSSPKGTRTLDSSGASSKSSESIEGRKAEGRRRIHTALLV